MIWLGHWAINTFPKPPALHNELHKALDPATRDIWTRLRVIRALWWYTRHGIYDKNDDGI